MKNLSRLTALLLALMMLFTSMPAFAETGVAVSDYTKNIYDASLASQTTDTNEQSTESTVEPVIIPGGEVIDYPTEEQGDVSAYENEDTVSLNQNAVGSESERSVMLYIYDKVTLSSGISGGQWQVQVGDIWVNVSGETGSTFDVTYAKVESLFKMNGYAKVRCISADGATVSDIANIGLSYEPMTLPVVEDELVSNFSLARNANNNDGIALAAVEGEEEEEPKKVIVEIAYLYSGTDEAVATSYSAEIEKGGDLTTSVITLPEIEGYVASSVTPKDDGVTFVPGTSIQLTLEDVTENVTYIVAYTPTFVDFKVEHYLMGFDAEQSTAVLDDTVTYSNVKKTNDEVGSGLEKTTYKGFTALWYDDTTKVAADGSTTIKIYYERNWYLMLFDLGDGGYGVEPIYAQFGADINVGTPTKPGYTFKGWSLDGTNVVALPEKMPAENKTYIAVWEKAKTATVSVVFWGENANDEEYSYYGTGILENAEVDKSLTYTGQNLSLYYCGLEAHTHSDACERLLGCTIPEHAAHTADCLTCTIPEHAAHTADCLTCTKEIHAHSSACCTLEAHTHTPSNCCSIEVHEHTDSCCRYGGTSYSHWWHSDDCCSLGKTAHTHSTNYNRSDCNTSKCGKTAHTHGTGCVYCKENKEEHAAHTEACYSDVIHTHTDTCYSDVIHTHTDTCYYYNCGLTEHTHGTDCSTAEHNMTDTTRWKLVKSDTVTVLPDGTSVINVYYDRVEYSVQFYSNSNCSSSNEYTSLKITAKWGANILSKWPTYNGSASWYVPNKEKTWQNSIQVMPIGGAKFWGPKSGSNSYKAYYYVEALPGATDTVTHNGVTYILHHTDTSISSGNVTDEEKYGINGFTYKEGTSNGVSYSNAKFYYTRNSYNLVFNDGYSNIREESVKFEAPLSTYASYKPTAAPAIYEAGSVEFGGWYLNPDCSGDQFSFTTTTMPADNLILYAKWELVEHEVTFYTKEEDIAANKPLVEKFYVTHYDTVMADDDVVENGGTRDIPTKEEMAGKNENYSFVGWFYTDTDGKEKAFDPNTMPVVKNLVIYGKWNATDPVPFTIYYKLVNENGSIPEDWENATNVAEPLVSKALDGTTITVEAKTGNDLYADYREGYFPKPPSHSVEIEVTSDNQYIFWYTPAQQVPYKVVYLLTNDDGTYTEYVSTDANVPSPKLVSDNKKTVVTENAIRIKGYMPDAYQKRLIVSYPGYTDDQNGNNKTDSDKAENIIYFYYHKDTENAYWTVSHFIQPIDGSDDTTTWTQYGITESQTGKIDDPYTATPKDIPGFTLTIKKVDLYDSEGDTLNKDTNLTETLTDGGMDFRLYYTRNEYPILVQHKLQNADGTTTDLAVPMLYNAGATYDYQSQVSVSTDKTFSGYKLVSTNPQVHTVVIDGTTLETVEKNIVTFYYEENEAKIYYVPVGPDGVNDGAGTTTPVDETVKAVTGYANGSAAEASSNAYKFVGWYSDVECKNLITTDATYVPAQPGRTSTEADGVTAVTNGLWPAVTTYYAKFDWNISTLTITKSGMAAGESAIFTVTAITEDGEKTFTVTVPSGSSVKIHGVIINSAYSVTEKGDWTWRYTSESTNATGTIAPTGSTAAFTNTKSNNQWLDYESKVDNVFEEGTTNN